MGNVERANTEVIGIPEEEKGHKEPESFLKR